MTDYDIVLKDDWSCLKEEVLDLLYSNPNLTVHQVADITGGDYEDILWIMKTNR
jgi:hypothetical protein